jgi:hypothetical protein
LTSSCGAAESEGGSIRRTDFATGAPSRRGDIVVLVVIGTARWQREFDRCEATLVTVAS